MKCNVCHNEFGNGEYCQNCKADKVVGLGSYTGYNAPHIQHNLPHQSPQQRTTQIVDSNMTICYKCANPIPANVDFCPACGLKLMTTCPKCGNRFSSRYAFCGGCGVNAQSFIIEQENQRRVQAEEDARRKRAEEARQAELERERLEELRKIEAIKNTPEFIEALKYLTRLCNEAKKKAHITNRPIADFLFLGSFFIIPIIFTQGVLDIENEFIGVVVSLAIGFPLFFISWMILHWLDEKYFPENYYNIVVEESYKYMEQHNIQNIYIKELIEKSIKVISEKGIDWNDEELEEIILTAYFDITNNPHSVTSNRG